MENRKSGNTKSSPLPVDYLKLVGEVFGTNFDSGLKALRKLTKEDFRFEARGQVYPSEIVLGISLIPEKALAATTVLTSADFDPKASAPTLEDLLSKCVDAAGSIFAQLLDPTQPKRLEQVTDESLSALENVPFEWASVTVEKQKLFLKVDKSNPTLDEMTDDWLAKNDPNFRKEQDEEHDETEKLFVTGPGGNPKSRKLH